LEDPNIEEVYALFFLIIPLLSEDFEMMRWLSHRKDAKVALVF